MLCAIAMSEKRDWDKSYKHGDTPWDSGLPSSELVKALDSGIVAPCRALDLGCGTGTNAIYLTQKGFDVTAVDLSDVAIEIANEKAAALGIKVDFIKTTLPDLNIKGGPFDFVFDRGCFHAIDNDQRIRYAEMLKHLTRKNSIFLLLCGNANEPREDGPPTVTESEIRETFSGLFDFIWLRDFRFDTLATTPGPLGYSCLIKHI